MCGEFGCYSLCFLQFRFWALTCIADSVTSISGLSSTPTPVPGPPPSGPAGIVGASTAPAKDAAPGGPLVLNGEASALNWLMAWLGEQDLGAEVPEALPEEASVPSPVQPKVHWLSLLPTVPAFEAPDHEENQQSGLETVPVETPMQVGVSVAASEESPLPVLAVESGEKEDPVEVNDADPAGAIPAAPASALVPVALVAPPSLVVVPVPVTPDAPPPPSADTSKVVGANSPVADGTPGPPVADGLQGVSSVGQRTAPKPDDKGEVIWSAEFTVQEKQPAETGATDSTPVSRSQPEAASKPLRTVESDAPAKPAIAGVRARQPEDAPRQQMGPDDREPNADERDQKQPAIDPARERMSGKNSQDSKREASSTGSEHSEPKLTESGSRTTAFAAEFASRATAPSRVSETASVESVALEPAAPLKPAQIATLQVDVPAPVGSDDMTPMRLVVSQRGDQVNVRLRSFDSAVAPIEDTRMQPLLHSLAEKGFVAELKPGARLDESMPLTVERTQEKQMVMAESSGSQNDAQSFQNANERQQQNQERQQQQQAFFLRKQLKNVRSEAFTLPVAAEANKGAFQKGVSR